MRRYILLVLLAAMTLAVLGGTGITEAANPLLITNVGQGAESAMVNVLCKKEKIAATLNDTITASELAGPDGKAKFSFMAVVVGYSGKGMGAAGVNIDQELVRAHELMKKAQSLKLPIIIMHIGGIDRRGESSDRLIKEIFKYANYALFVSAGNYPDSGALDKNKPDNLLTNSLSKGVTPKIVSKINDIVAPLKGIMGL